MTSRGTCIAVFAFCLLAQIAFCQVRLELATHEEGKHDSKPAVILANECSARMDADGDVYLLLQDCGKTLISVSEKDRAAVKMPPMQSSAAGDLKTGVLFLQGTPQIAVEKVEEKPGPKLLDRETTYYHFRAVHRPDPALKEDVTLFVDEEFWTDSTLNLRAVEGLLGKVPLGASHQAEAAAFAQMKGLPLKHRTAVTIQRSGNKESQAPYVQEVTKISRETLDESTFSIPKNFRVMDLTQGVQQ